MVYQVLFLWNRETLFHRAADPPFTPFPPPPRPLVRRKLFPSASAFFPVRVPIYYDLSKRLAVARGTHLHNTRRGAQRQCDNERHTRYTVKFSVAPIISALRPIESPAENRARLPWRLWFYSTTGKTSELLRDLCRTAFRYEIHSFTFFVSFRCNFTIFEFDSAFSFAYSSVEKFYY